MLKLFHFLVLFFALSILCTKPISAQGNNSKKIIDEAKAVIARNVSAEVTNKIKFSVAKTEKTNGEFSYKTKNGQLYISGNSTVALCHGFYDYLKTSQQGMITWGGNNFNLSNQLKDVPEKKSGISLSISLLYERGYSWLFYCLLGMEPLAKRTGLDGAARDGYAVNQ